MIRVVVATAVSLFIGVIRVFKIALNIDLTLIHPTTKIYYKCRLARWLTKFTLSTVLKIYEIEVYKMIRKTLTVTDVANLLGVSSYTIYNMVRDDQIPYIKVRTRILFRLESINAWIDQMEGKGPDDNV